MNDSDTYREWSPPRSWSAMVACLWEQRIGNDGGHRVVPDGCADVIVASSGATAVGLADGPVVHHLGSGSRALGMRLRPEAVATFFGTSAEELRNMELPLDDVVGSRRARKLVNGVLGGQPDPLVLATPPPEVVKAIELLVDRSVDATATLLGLSSRHLRRSLLHHTGLGPKEHQRVMRLRRFIDHSGPLGIAAVQSGYADQSHLTREVKRMCGVSPAQLRVERNSA